MRNIFLGKWFKNFVEKQVLEYFLKNQNCSYHWINNLNFIVFLSHVQPLVFTSYKEKQKQKKGLELVCCIIFEENNFSHYILLTHQISLSDCLYFLIYLTICVLELYQNCFLHDLKSQEKFLNILRTKKGFKMK